MKQACWEESIVSLFFPYLNIYRTLLLGIEHCTTEKSKHRPPIFNFCQLKGYQNLVCLTS